MKRKLAITWLVLVGLTVGFLVIGWLFLPGHAGEPFWQMAKGATAGIALMMPAVRYLRNERDRRELNRAKELELEEADRRLDAIEKAIKEGRKIDGV